MLSQDSQGVFPGKPGTAGAVVGRDLKRKREICPHFRRAWDKNKRANNLLTHSKSRILSITKTLLPVPYSMKSWDCFLGV
jgi:hypothetical protein